MLLITFLQVLEIICLNERPADSRIDFDLIRNLCRLGFLIFPGGF